MPVVLGQDLDVRTRLVDPRRADKDAAQRQRVALEVEVGLEAVHLPSPRVSLAVDVHESQVPAVEHDRPRTGAEDRAVEAAYGLIELVEAHQAREGRRLAARDHEPVQSTNLRRLAHL